jgi:hypothetical protein
MQYAEKSGARRKRIWGATNELGHETNNTSMRLSTCWFRFCDRPFRSKSALCKLTAASGPADLLAINMLLLHLALAMSAVFG